MMNKSGFGNTPEDPFLVFESKRGLRGKQQTSCFVLRPSGEKIAFRALEFFYTILEEEDSRRDFLRNYLERVKSMWIEREK